MPNAGQVNNSGGVNGYTGPGGSETPYGAVKRLGQITQGLPGAPGANAPKQASRAAARGTQEPQPVTPQQTVMAAPQVPLPVAYAQAWAAVASTPGASPLVQAIAQEAQRGV